MMNYHDRRFIPVSNSANGEVSPDVVFHYQQTGRIVTCRYSGGRIVSGQLIPRSLGSAIRGLSYWIS